MSWIHAALVALTMGAFLSRSVAAPAPSASSDPGRGANVFNSLCSQCHVNSATRAPRVNVLRYMSAGAIYRALSSGAMKLQAANLSEEDKLAVARYLSGNVADDTPGAGAPPCVDRRFDFNQPPAFAGWGLEPGNSRYMPVETSGLTAGNLHELHRIWAMSFPSALRVRSQPAFAGGAIFVGSQDGTVYSLDLDKGCARWTFKAAAEVRTGLVVSAWAAGDSAARPAVYFGDLIGNLYSLDAVTGAAIWQSHTDPHPSVTLSGTPTLYRGRLFVPVSSLEEAVNDPHYECCTFRGSVIGYDAISGKPLWQTFMVARPRPVGHNAAGTLKWGPSGAAIWGSPAVDEMRGLIYVGTGDNYSDPFSDTSDSIVAIAQETGRIRWKWQAEAGDAWNAGCVSEDKALCPLKHGPDSDFGAPPILATLAGGRQIILAGQKSGWVYALDPDRHEPIWKRRVGRGGIEGGVHFGMSVASGRLFVPINDMTDAAYGITLPEPARPGVYALDVESGRVAWSQTNDSEACQGRQYCSGGYSAAISTTGNLVLAGSIDGWLRVMDAASGRVLWKYDTTLSVPTVGGGTTSGGSMAGATSAIAFHGKLIVESGYDFSAKMPGNVLLVFANGERRDGE